MLSSKHFINFGCPWLSPPLLTWTIRWRNWNTSATLAFFLVVATTFQLSRCRKLAEKWSEQTRRIQKFWEQHCSCYRPFSPNYSKRKDTEQVVVFDVDERSWSMDQDWCHTAFLFLFHEHGHELIYHRHVYIPSVVPAYQHLMGTQFFYMFTQRVNPRFLSVSVSMYLVLPFPSCQVNTQLMPTSWLFCLVFKSMWCVCILLKR